MRHRREMKQAMAMMLDKTAEEIAVADMLRNAGYTEPEIEDGLRYARGEGATWCDELARLALSRILYSDAQLSRGERFAWEPIDWSEYLELEGE